MRKTWLDYIRVYAVLAVIIGHISADFYSQFGEISNIGWWLANLISAFARPSIGLFVMVSGALLLGRNYTVLEFYKKRAVRLLPALIFWNLVYLAYYVYDGIDMRTLAWMLKAQIFANGFVAPHLWYLSMLVCLMLFAPFINQFIKGIKPAPTELAILLGLMAVFFLLNSVSLVADEIFDLTINWFTIYIPFMTYFIAGYYIDQYGADIPVKKRVLVVLVALLITAGMMLNYLAVSSFGIIKDYFVFDHTGILTLVIVLLIFLLLKKMSSVFQENRIISIISEASFGIYLIHEIFISILVQTMPTYFSQPLISIPVVFVATSIMSFTAIVILRKVPLFRLVS